MSPVISPQSPFSFTVIEPRFVPKYVDCTLDDDNVMIAALPTVILRLCSHAMRITHATLPPTALVSI